MKQFIYQPHHVGLGDWPSWSLRLAGIETTTNPNEADLLVIPDTLTNASRNPSDWSFPTRESILRLPFIHGREDRHVFMDGSDNEPLYDLPCIFIRQNTRPWYLQRDPNTVSWPWPVENYQDCVELPEGGFRHDITFQGWLHHDTRKQSFASVSGLPQLKSHLRGYSDFCGYLWDREKQDWKPEGHRRRDEFRRGMRESRLCLCPEQINGVYPYRYWETLSAGRVPLLVGSDFVWPFQDEIPYKDFTVTCSRADASRANQVAIEFLKTHTDKQIIEMGLMARHYFERYLWRDKWPELMAEAVIKHLEMRKAA